LPERRFTEILKLTEATDPVRKAEFTTQTGGLSTNVQHPSCSVLANR
jgi:hypothetical protein